MAYTVSPMAHSAAVTRVAEPRAAVSARKSGLLVRILGAFAAARQRQADRIIAEMIDRQGGKFTDATERRIERQVF